MPTSSPNALVSVVLPCRNEAHTVGACVREAFHGIHNAGLHGEVVVVDNASSDDSADLARTEGARVVACCDVGYGSAVRFGIATARNEIVVFADADGSYVLSEIDDLVQPLIGGADIVIGNRFLGGIEPGAMPWSHRYLGTPMLSILHRLLFGSGCGDINCGIRAVARSAFLKLDLQSTGMEFASEMMAKASVHRYRVVEVAVRLRRDRRVGKPHLSPLRDGVRHLCCLAKERWAISGARSFYHASRRL